MGRYFMKDNIRILIGGIDWERDEKVVKNQLVQYEPQILLIILTDTYYG